MSMAKRPARDLATELAAEIVAALQRERPIPRFVDSYVVEHGRHALQAHPTRYRELLALLNREALLAMTLRALEEEASLARQSAGKRRNAGNPQAFRRNFLTSLARLQKWSAGDALDFQAELRIYEDLFTRSPGARRARKAYEAADHPFVDRCAILLDPPFIEQARIAASRALAELESLATALTANLLSFSPH